MRLATALLATTSIVTAYGIAVRILVSATDAPGLAVLITTIAALGLAVRRRAA